MNPIWRQGMPLVYQRKIVPFHLVSMRKTLLPKAQLRWVHLYYLERTWSHFPHHLTGSPKWRKTSHDTQNDPLHTQGACVKAKKGQTWLLQCRSSQGSERLSYHFGGATSVSLGHAWGLKTLRRPAQPVGGNNQRSQEGRQRHLPGLPRRPSF